MADTKRLDAMLDALRDTPATRRAPRRGVELQVFVDSASRYTITANGRTIELGMELRDGHAMQRAGIRAAALRQLGKQVTITLI